MKEKPNNIVITGTLYRKADNKVLAVGELEALNHFLKTTQKLNPKSFRKKDFEVIIEYNEQAITQAGIIMTMDFGGSLRMYSKSKTKPKN